MERLQGAPSTERLKAARLRRFRFRTIKSLQALLVLGIWMLLLPEGITKTAGAALPHNLHRLPRTGSREASMTLDRFGGDPRLKSKIHNVNVTFFGKSTRLSLHSLADRAAQFPTDGRLVGKLISPNYKHPESASSPEKWFRIVANTATTILTNPADGDMTKYAKPGDPYEVTGVFKTELIGHRWWFVDPEGNVFFPKAVSKTDTTENFNNTWGNLQGYDAVYLESHGGEFTRNLKREAENPYPADVVKASGVTLRSVGDAIYIGSRKPFDVTYFDLTQLGAKGRVKWFYSSNDVKSRWRLINGTGNPAGGAALDADGSYNLDTGNYYAPDRFSGELVPGNPRADKIYWWKLEKISSQNIYQPAVQKALNALKLSQGSLEKFDVSDQLGNQSVFPMDFAPTSLPADPTARYYIKGVVAAPFATAPVLSQLYDPTSPQEVVPIKYSGPPGTNPYFNWFRAINQRYRAWGWNSAGEYSFEYTAIDGNFPSDRMPTELTIPLSTRAMSAKGRWHIKNVFDGQQCPPGSGKLLWQGLTPDVFDPRYKTAIKSLAGQLITSNPWTFEIIPEEGDDVYGLNSTQHQNMGYVVLSQNPYKPTCCRASKDPSLPANEIPVKDTKLYSKYALRDFLRYRYKSADDPLPPFTINSVVPAYKYHRQPVGFELAALERLNKAWGTRYTTWGTSSGSLERGTNAWGRGTGFMDENGRGVFPGTCKISYNDFHKPGFPKVRQDLDDFVAFFIRKYGSIIFPAVKAHTANLVGIPLYVPPSFVARAIRPYADLLSTTAGGQPERARNIYNHFKKPLMVEDYLTADPDSPLYFGGRITDISYDPTHNRTRIMFSGLPYKFSRIWPVEFPILAKEKGCGNLATKPTPTKTAWNSVELKGNYTVPGCLRAGDRIEIARRANEFPTQEDRARAMERLIKTFTQLRGKDDNYFIAGWEHWAYMDWPLLGYFEHADFGLVTALDNAYDGVEARREVGKDRNGRFVGGEDENYGNLIGTLAPFLRGLYDQFIPESR